jgi:hypothetical protein
MNPRLFGMGVQTVLKVASQILRANVAGELGNAVSGVGGGLGKSVVRNDDGDARVLRQLNAFRQLNAPVPIRGFNRLTHGVMVPDKPSARKQGTPGRQLYALALN